VFQKPFQTDVEIQRWCKDLGFVADPTIVNLESLLCTKLGADTADGTIAEFVARIQFVVGTKDVLTRIFVRGCAQNSVH
jgi:hypothetical protein